FPPSPLCDVSRHRRQMSRHIVDPQIPTIRLVVAARVEGQPVAELALECAERFLATHLEGMSDISTRAAGDARHVGELLLRTYAQASDAALRARALDAVDELLLAQAQGIDELLEDVQR